MEAVHLAAAVHDLEPRVVLTGIEEVAIQKGEKPRFRVSFRLADHASAREEAILQVSAHLCGATREREAVMHDHLLRDDETYGILEFEFDPPPKGRHEMRFQVHLRTSVKGSGGLGKTRLDGQDAEGSVWVKVS